MTKLLSAWLLITVPLGVLPLQARAENPCGHFKWDVTHERAVFAQTAVAVSAAQDSAHSPELVPERLYELALVPQSGLTLLSPLGKKADFSGALGGLARVRVPAAGRYRVSLGESGWIDLIGEHGVIPSSDFSGGGGCSAPGKIVEFDLPQGSVIVQLVGLSGTPVRIAVTRAP